jgi:hypothetical protein
MASVEGVGVWERSRPPEIEENPPNTLLGAGPAGVLTLAGFFPADFEVEAVLEGITSEEREVEFLSSVVVRCTPSKWTAIVLKLLVETGRLAEK